ncbi:MAG: alpha/beta hydrolase [Usitatibacter sp.]
MAWLSAAAAAALITYGLVAALVWFAQERLIFFPQPRQGSPLPPAGWLIEEVHLQAGDGTPLAGVLVKPPSARPPLVIYFGGNAEEVTGFAPFAAQTYGERAALFVNYRGYGASGGRPGQRVMVADAAEVFDWAARRTDIDGDRIAIHGRSLGASVAVHTASQRPARCVVLTSPFDSARAVAQRVYPWLPVGLLIRHPFDSLALAPKLKMPVLVLMGDSDNVVPMSHSKILADAWGGPVERRVFAGFGHNDLGVNPGYDEAIRAFLSRCL